MGQAIRSRNLRKIGFSVVNGVWTKTSVAEGEAISGEAQEVQEEVGEAAVLLNQEESAAVAAEVQEEIPEAPATAVPDAPIDPESARGESQVVQEKSAEQAATPAEEQAADFIQEIVEEIRPSDRRIEDIPLEHLVPVEEFQEISPPTSRIGSVLRRALESIPSTQDVEEVASKKEEVVASGHTEEVVMEDAPIQGEQEITVEEIQMEDAPTKREQNQENEVVASGHNDIQMEDPPVQDEQIAAVHDDTPMENAPAEGENLGEKGSEPQGERTENPPENQFREGETTSSSDSDDQDDHVDQQEPVDKAREKGKEVASDIPLLADAPHQRPQRQKIVINLKHVIERLDAQDFLKEVRAPTPPAPPPPAPQPSEGAEEDVPRPSGSVPAEESGPSGPSIVEEAPQPTGPSAEGPAGPVEEMSGPTGPVATESEQFQAEEEAVAPEPPAPSPIQTPAPPSPPSSSTSPPAPQPFKQPQSRTISSPTPFPSHSPSSPVSSTHIPPASSSARASSSSGPSSSAPPDTSSFFPHSFLHPTPPPSFITIIPEDAQVDGPFLRAIKDEFEEAILRSVLKSRRRNTSRPQSGRDWPDRRDLNVTACTVTFPTPEPGQARPVRPSRQAAPSRPGPRRELPLNHFEHFARVTGRIKMQKGYLVAFHRFLFREYHQGHVSADVLAPALSECERLSPIDWIQFYPLSAQQLSDVNESQAREGNPPVSAATFLDMNSIHLVTDPFQTWVERYKVYVAMHQELKHKQIFYPFNIDQFLACASFGKVSFFKTSFDRNRYADFLDEQLVLHLRRMAPTIGPTYSLSPGVFKLYFEQ
ncbi:hypothetical protein Taro_033574 [Colocasia esculenta]|uniref:Uncharacterized protein n=1 Tax=Colocasia esculenta TaxID=4460 RepID=A0A843VP36_COLES|nr:hypothetical protein [Colocasia esculenta]